MSGQFAQIEAALAHRAASRQLDARLYQYSKEIRATLDSMASDTVETLSQQVPEVKWSLSGEMLLPLLVEFLNGAEHHDPDENK